jgi:hypothetical protein
MPAVKHTLVIEWEEKMEKEISWRKGRGPMKDGVGQRMEET